MHRIFLAIVLIQAVFALNFSNDLNVCQKKLEKFKEEKNKMPKNVAADLASIKVQLNLCEDALKCVEGVKDQIPSDQLQYIKTICESLRFLAGPYHGCPEKLVASKDKADCTVWAVTLDQSIYYIPKKERCEGFKQRKDCIHKDVVKTCGVDAAKSFKENTAFLGTMLGCV